MKKILAALIFLFFLCSSCGHPSAGTSGNSGVSLEDYIAAAKLPDNFILNFDAEAVTAPDHAAIYQGEDCVFDRDLLLSVLLHNEVTQTESWAVGKRYLAGDDAFREYVTIYDGGESFGTDVGILGGFQYMIEENKRFKQEALSYTISAAGYNRPSSVRPPAHLEKSDFASGKDLAFQTYAEAERTMLSLMASVGAPEICVAETYTLDCGTMNEHLDLYEQETGEAAMEMYTGEELFLTEQDEGYLFYISQTIDGIPIINQEWGGQGKSTALYGNPMVYTQGTVVYDAHGLAYLDVTGLRQITKTAQAQPILPPADALDRLLSYYADVIIPGSISVDAMQLNYVTLEKEAPYELCPAWVFYLLKTNYVDEFPQPLESYEIFVIDAITGEKISG